MMQLEQIERKVSTILQKFGVDAIAEVELELDGVYLVQLHLFSPLSHEIAEALIDEIQSMFRGNGKVRIGMVRRY